MRQILFFILVMFLAAAFSCSLPEEPKEPTWDIQLVDIYVVKGDTLRIGEELSKDEENLQAVGADSLLQITFDGSTEFKIDDQLKQDPKNDYFSTEIGDIEVAAFSEVAEKAYLSDLFPTEIHNSTAILPATDPFPTVTKNYNFTSYQSVNFKTGTMSVKVTNNIDPNLPIGPLTLTIYDRNNMTTAIGTADFDILQYGESQTKTISLNGKTLSNQIQVSLTGATPGSGGVGVFIQDNTGLDMGISVSNITATQATAELPTQTFSLTSKINVNSSTVRVSSAKVQSGSMTLNLNNTLPLPVDITLTIPNLLDGSSSPVTSMFSIGANGTHTEYISMNNTTMTVTQDSIGFNIAASINPVGGVSYTITNTDYISANVNLSQIVFNEITGSFDVSTTIDPTSEDVFDSDINIDGISLDDASVVIQTVNSPYTLDISLFLQAVKETESLTLNVNTSVGPNGSITLDNNGVNNNHSSPTIVDLVNLLPYQFNMSGSADVHGTNVTVSRGDIVSVNYTATVPFSLTFNGAAFTEDGKMDFDEDDDVYDPESDQRKMVRQLLDAGLNGTIINHTPFAGVLNIETSQDSVSWNVLTTVNLPQSTLSTTGFVQSAGDEAFNVSISQEGFERLSYAKYYRAEVVIQDVDGAKLASTDFIIIKDIYINGKFRVDIDKLSDDDE